MTEAEVAALRRIVLGAAAGVLGAGPKAESVTDVIIQRLVEGREFYYLPQKLPGE